MSITRRPRLQHLLQLDHKSLQLQRIARLIVDGPADSPDLFIATTVIAMTVRSFHVPPHRLEMIEAKSQPTSKPNLSNFQVNYDKARPMPLL